MGGYREGIGHELLTIIVRFAPILVSTLDPSSLAYGIAVLFDSRSRVTQVTRLAAPLHKRKNSLMGVFAFLLLGGYRESNPDNRYHKPV